MSEPLFYPTARVAAGLSRGPEMIRLGIETAPIVELLQPASPPLYRECLASMVVSEAVLLDEPASPGRRSTQGDVGLLDVATLALVLDTLAQDEAARLGLVISAEALADRDHWRAVIRLVEARPWLAARLTVAIRESADLQDIAQAPVRLAELRRLGCRLAIDDFGSTFPAPGRGGTLDVAWDLATFDLAFPDYRRRKDRDCATLQALALRAASVARSVSVRGVESQAHFEAARAAGIHYGQGRFFARPEGRRWTVLTRTEGAMLAAAMMAAGAILRHADEEPDMADASVGAIPHYLLSRVDGLGDRIRSLIDSAWGCRA